MTAMKTRKPAARRASKPADAKAQQELDWTKLIETALTAPGSTGDTYCRFYEYSFMNQIFLLMQGVTEPVATYKRWSEMGRQVQKGSKSFAIVRPITIKITDTDADGNEVKRSFGRFKVVNCLFTASQTEGEELKPAPVRGWDRELAEKTLGVVQVPYADLDGNKQGYSTGNTYAINPVAVAPEHTRFHELGHIVLGHTTPDGLAEYQLHRGNYEFEAEATAYLVMHELGLLDEQAASHSRAYIQGWLRRADKPSDASIRKVFAAVNKILQAGRNAPAGADNEGA